jgi:O-Antigen ligase
VSLNDETARLADPAAERRLDVRVRPRGDVGVGVVWLLGSVIVVAAQPGLDRKGAAAGAAAAAIAAILVVSTMTADPRRRYFRSILTAIVLVSVAATWLLRGLTGIQDPFRINGLEERIALPLVFVLVLPLVVRELPPRLRGRAGWRELRAAWRLSRPLDRLMVGYAALSVPALLLGLAHHAPKTFIAQDLGLVAIFALVYCAGRAVDATAALASAPELVDVLLLLSVAQFVLFGWQPAPLYDYTLAASVGALAFLVLRPGRVRLLPFAVAVTFLVASAAAIQNGTSSTATVELAGALGLLAYLVLRLRQLVPVWTLVACAVVGLVFFIGFTSDGATVRGQYHGTDPSNSGRTFEAQRVRAEVRGSPVSLVLGRGFGATIDERKAPADFKASLVGAGRDLAHVPQVHLLPYDFLLEYGLLGLIWLAAFAVGLAWTVLRGLERAVRERDPSFVIYAGLPLLVLAGAIAAASHLQANPLGALALGALVTLVGADGTRKPERQ